MKQIVVLVSATLLGFGVSAQHKQIASFVEAQTGFTTNDAIPFWLRSNQYGSVPIAGFSTSLITGGKMEYDSVRSKKLIDWGGAIAARLNIGKGANFRLIEGYAKLRVWAFQVKAGRSRDQVGLVDSTLSSGGFAMSGNAVGVPKVEVSVPQFANIFGGTLFAFKGNFSHGWMGRQLFNKSEPVKERGQVNSFLHQSSFYGRFGKPAWKIKLYGGFSHQVMWSNEQVPENRLGSTFKTYLYVISGKTFQRYSKIGNHLGSIDLGFDYNFPAVKLMVYRQNFYDEGALFKLANINDGLNGIVVSNKQVSKHKFKWNKILFEILNTRNQAGYPWSPTTKSGDEDYYNNYLFVEGYTYRQMNLGSPFLTTKATASGEVTPVANQYFVNNRVLAFHAGFQGSYGEYQLMSKASYSRNYGTFGTSEYQRDGRVGFPSGRLFKQVGEFSAVVSAQRQFKKGFTGGVTTAFDCGGLLSKSFALMFRVTKTLPLIKCGH